MIDNLIWFLERIVEYAFGPFSSWEGFRQAIRKIVGLFTDFDSELAWPYLLAAFVLAGGVYFYVRKKNDSPPQSFWSFLCPRRVYLHSSAVLDTKFFAVNRVLTFLLWIPIISGMNLVVYKLISSLLRLVPFWEPPSSLSTGQILVSALAFFVAHDFINYWAHVWFHKNPTLWTFHRVHHSAQVLTPLTAFRVHPVEFVVPALLQMPVIGLAAVFFQDIPSRDMGAAVVCGVSVFTFFSNLFGHHLRHSHVWLSFGPFLSRVYISPAQHQIHHSTDPRHLNKNFGIKFAFWDLLFGTLYVPKEREQIRVGLCDAGPSDFATVRALYFQPLVELAGHFVLGANPNAGRQSAFVWSAIRRMSSLCVTQPSHEKL